MHQSRLRAPVLGQLTGFLRVVVDQCFEQARVGALETHDGLLEIADDQCGDARSPQLPQQLELDWVGVLKFVHNHAVDAPGQRVQHSRLRAQEAARCRDHVVVVDQAGLPLGVIVVAQGSAGGVQRRGEMLDGVLERPRMRVEARSCVLHSAS